MMFRSLTSRIVGLGAMLFAAICALAALLLLSAHEVEKSFAWVAHTQRVLKLTAEPVDMLREAESQLRGALISNDPSFAADTLAVLKRASDSVETLVRITADHPAQHQRAKRLREALHRRSAYLTQGLGYSSGGQFSGPAGAELIRRRNIAGRDMMREVDARRTEMLIAEQALLQQRSAAATRVLRRNQALVIVGGPLMGILIVLMVGIIARSIRRPSRAIVAAMERVGGEGSSVRLDPATMGSVEFRQIAEGYNAMADRLDQAMLSQRSSEDQLHAINTQLQERSAALEARSQVIERLGAMAHRMQAARTEEELAAVIGSFVPQILPGIAGAVYAHNNSRNQLVRIARWGEDFPAADLFSPDDCWALRLGQGHTNAGRGDDVVCAHVGRPTAYHCEPLLAGGEVIGLVHLDGQVAAENLFRLEALSENIASALVNHRLQRNLREQSIRDPLTGLFNRRYLEEALAMEVARASRAKTPLTVIMCDIDHFKRFNDDYGHDAGDLVLKAVAAEMRSHFRDGDIVCRLGGEEFTVIAPGATPEAITPRVERLRQAINQLALRMGTKSLGRVSMSFGLASHADPMAQDGSTLMQIADEALYRAKREGRNRAVIAEALAA